MAYRDTLVNIDLKISATGKIFWEYETYQHRNCFKRDE
jgi:hypothetical protein